MHEFVNRARYQEFTQIPMSEFGFDVTKIDYTSFRRNFGSLMSQEQMKEERKRIMMQENEKKRQLEKEQEEQAMKMIAKFNSANNRVPPAQTFMIGGDLQSGNLRSPVSQRLSNNNL